MEEIQMERVCACALNHIFGFEPKYSASLVEAFGSARAVFRAPAEQLDSIMGPYSRFKGKICRQAMDEAAGELERLARSGYRFIASGEDCYPALLKECPDAPAGLYFLGASPPEEVFNRRQSISVVGTRDISPYGTEWCPKLIRALSQAPEPPVITSGLAIGVDIAAHMAALSFGLPTIAVLPTGIDDIYPRRHRVAAGKIASSPGSALITDYPPGTQALAIHFLRRNRIIAGLSRATVLIESKVKGGGTMTARLASGYGRDVFVLPGRVDDVRSAGCNLLLKEKIAEPIISMEGAGEALGLGKYNFKKPDDAIGLARKIYSGRLSAEDMSDMEAIIGHIRRNRGATPDGICSACGLPYGKVAVLTGMLESDGLIEMDLMQRCTFNSGFL